MTEPPQGDGATWKAGDRIWLLPDGDKREVKSKLPGVVVKALDSGRVKVIYIDQRCTLSKTVEPKRIEHREIACPDLRKHERC